MLSWKDGPNGIKVRRVKGELETELPAEVICPNGHKGYIDPDQLHGRASMECYACAYHETHDLSALIA